MTGGYAAREAAAWRAIARHPAAVGLALGTVVFVVLFLLPPGNEARRGSAPTRPRGQRVVRIACDDAFRAFVDGQPAGESRSWSSAQSISIPDTDRVLVAVEATNHGGPGGLVGGWLSGPEAPRVVPASWVCHASREPGWQLPEFDDGAWKPAVSVRRFGEAPWGLEPGLDLSAADWVWARLPVGQETIYCRWWISRSRQPERPAASPVEPGEAAAPVPLRDDPASPTLIVAADDAAQVFVDGRLAIRSDTWAAPARIALPKSGRRILIAVEARNELGPGGLIGAWRSPQGLTVPAEWTCRETLEPGWNQPRDDPRWPRAVMISPYGEAPWGRTAGGDLDGAAWWWTRSPAEERQAVYCRWWIPAHPASKR